MDATHATLPILLTVEEVAKTLRLSAGGVRNLLARGELTGISIGVGGVRCHRRVTSESVAGFLARQISRSRNDSRGTDAAADFR